MPDVIVERHLHARLSELTPRLRALDQKLSRVTSSICGNTPESASGCSKASIDTVHDKLDVATQIVASLEDEMVRLENAVGQDIPLKAQAFQSETYKNVQPYGLGQTTAIKNNW